MDIPEVTLTRRQLEVLRLMAQHRETEEGELIYQSGRGYVGDSPVSGRTVFQLLRACAISKDQFSDRACERYHINGTGLQILERAKERAK